MVEARGVDLPCGASRVAAADPTLRCPKNRSGLLRPSGFSTAAEIACCLSLPPAAATRNSPGTPFTPAPVQLPVKVLPKAKSSRLTVRAFHFWWRRGELTCPAGQAASGCKAHPEPCQVPSGSNPRASTSKQKTPAVRAGIFCLAEKPGFEPGRGSTPPTPLAGEPLRPLGYFSRPLEQYSIP